MYHPKNIIQLTKVSINLNDAISLALSCKHMHLMKQNLEIKVNARMT